MEPIIPAADVAAFRKNAVVSHSLGQHASGRRSAHDREASC